MYSEPHSNFIITARLHWGGGGVILFFFFFPGAREGWLSVAGGISINVPLTVVLLCGTAVVDIHDQ